ncbi:MAG: hypothetical protein U0Q16_09285 [Bryobacteraceae bacterium]
MTVELDLPPGLSSLVERELAKGTFHGPSDLVERALTAYFEQMDEGRRQHGAILRIGQLVDEAGFYDLVPDPPVSRHE